MEPQGFICRYCRLSKYAIELSPRITVYRVIPLPDNGDTDLRSALKSGLKQKVNHADASGAETSGREARHLTNKYREKRSGHCLSAPGPLHTSSSQSAQEHRAQTSVKECSYGGTSVGSS
jgi:hypothetical protein